MNKNPFYFVQVFSLFTIVRFANLACTGNNGYNGTCYTSAECSAKGGTGQGSCASGFGVCCVGKQLNAEKNLVNRKTKYIFSDYFNLWIDDQIKWNLLAESWLFFCVHFCWAMFLNSGEMLK